MTAFLVLLIPLALMAFALFMERVERRLRTRTVSEADVQEFLESARPEEVNTLMREGWTRAFDKFRLRRRPRFRRRTGANGKGKPTAATGPTTTPATPSAAPQAAPPGSNAPPPPPEAAAGPTA